jgi:hypothetical protein
VSARALLDRWKRFAHVVADVQARVLLAIVYFVVLPAFALVVRIGEDPFRPGWHPRKDTDPAQPARRQS